MFKAVVRSIATVLLSLVFSQVNASETVKVDVPQFEPVQLTFRAFDPQHVLINESVILGAIAQKLSATKLGQTQAMVSRVERGTRPLDLIELRDWLGGLDLDFLTFMTTLDAQLQAAPANDFGFRRSPPSADHG